MRIFSVLFLIFDINIINFKNMFEGTVVRGIRMPMFKEGDDLREIIVSTLLEEDHRGKNYSPDDRDVIGITESIVARCQGNYVTVDDIATDIKTIFNNPDEVGVVWPIFSRNRFAIILKGIARGTKKVLLQLGTGIDDVGNEFLNPYTGVNIIQYYKDIVEGEGAQCEIFLDDFTNTIPDKTRNIIIAETHKAELTIEMWSRIYGNHHFVTLADICNKEVPGRKGWNEDYGLYGSNKAGEELLKLFPRKVPAQTLVEGIQADIKRERGTDVEVMVYGDGCFKDPVSGIWEFADPVVSPAYTKGLEGCPNEVKIKYLLDTDLKDSETPEEDIEKIIEKSKKEESLVGKMISQGTTPRRYVDLLGSLFDLTSGSGAKGTPVVIAKGYFDSYEADY